MVFTQHLAGGVDVANEHIHGDDAGADEAEGKAHVLHH